MATWGIHHSSISVSDEEASLRFYRDGLGLKVVSEQTEKSDRLAEQVLPFAACGWRLPAATRCWS